MGEAKIFWKHCETSILYYNFAFNRFPQVQQSKVNEPLFNLLKLKLYFLKNILLLDETIPCNYKEIFNWKISYSLMPNLLN